MDIYSKMRCKALRFFVMSCLLHPTLPLVRLSPFRGKGTVLCIHIQFLWNRNYSRVSKKTRKVGSFQRGNFDLCWFPTALNSTHSCFSEVITRLMRNPPRNLHTNMAGKLIFSPLFRFSRCCFGHCYRRGNSVA